MTNVPPLFIFDDVIPANQSATYETFTSGDSIIHVNWRPAAGGGHIAGNDDCPGTPGSYQSCVTVPATSVSRQVTVIVRAYSSPGSGTFVAKHGSTTILNQSITFGGKAVSLGALPALSHVFTTRRQLGIADPVLLVIGSTLATAVKWDHDTGVGLNAWMHLDVAASGTVVVGHPQGNSPGEVTLLWDDKVHTQDADGDTLGDELEAVVGSNPNATDSDLDAIPDVDEVVGRDGANFVEYPLFGAQPNVVDKFVEVDWNACNTVTDPNCLQNSELIDVYQFSVAAEAARAVAAWWGPPGLPANKRIALHMDIGPVAGDTRVAGDPTLTQYGNWQGANRRPTPGSTCATDSRLAGRDRFHLGISDNWGGTAGYGSFCFLTSQNGRTLGHELGHNYYLSHGGQHAAMPTNYKVMYPSIMNYTWQNDDAVQFSNATFAGISFNPVGVSETTWNAGAPNANPSVLANKGYLVSGNNVDWNRNGKIDTGTVTAPPATFGEFSTVWNHGNEEGGLGTSLADPTIARYQTPVGQRWYVFYRRTTDNVIRYRYSSDVETSCSGGTLPDNDPGNYYASCGTFSSAANVPGTTTSTMAPAAVEFLQGGVRKIMLVWGKVTAPGDLKHRILTVSSGGAESWGAETDITDIDAISPPTLVFENGNPGRVHLYARVSGGILKRWSYNTNTSQWDVQGINQTWSGTGQNVDTNSMGVGLSWGYFSSGYTRYLFGAFPRTNENILFVRRSPTSIDQWENWATVAITTDAKPGLAYVLEKAKPPSSDLNIGRFYIAARSTAVGQPRIAFSRGNCESGCSSRHVNTWTVGFTGGQEDRALAGAAFSLAFEPYVDTNLRLSYTFSGASSRVDFAPIADGIVNSTVFKDEDDYEILVKNARCPFDSTKCYRCVTQNTNGTCATWTP